MLMNNAAAGAATVVAQGEVTVLHQQLKALHHGYGSYGGYRSRVAQSGMFCCYERRLCRVVQALCDRHNGGLLTAVLSSLLARLRVET